MLARPLFLSNPLYNTIAFLAAAPKLRLAHGRGSPSTLNTPWIYPLRKTPYWKSGIYLYRIGRSFAAAAAAAVAATGRFGL